MSITLAQSLKLNYQSVVEQISNCAKRHQRVYPGDVGLVAVSKFHSLESIALLYNFGQRAFGENYVAELVQKAQLLSSQNIHPEWHFTGRIQSNKIAKIVRYASVIHTLESEKHARVIARELVEQKIESVDVFIAVNLGEEKQKSGLVLSDVERFAHKIASSYPQINLLGLMTLPPSEVSASAQETNIPESYKTLVCMARNIGAGRVSLGMSADFEAAIAAGSHLLRIGSQIFGPRPEQRAKT